MGSFRPYLCVIGAVAFGLAAAGPALGDEPPSPPPPSINQYVESVPTATGGATRAVTKPHAKPLAPAVARRLRNSNNAVVKDLNSIATSSTYGAPQRKLTPPAPKPASAPGSRRGIHGSSAVSAAVSAVSDSGDSHVYWLLGAIIVITTSMVWAAGRRHRA
jgi:hypothetical protein